MWWAFLLMWIPVLWSLPFLLIAAASPWFRRDLASITAAFGKWLCAPPLYCAFAAAAVAGFAHGVFAALGTILLGVLLTLPGSHLADCLDASQEWSRNPFDWMKKKSERIDE